MLTTCALRFNWIEFFYTSSCHQTNSLKSLKSFTATSDSIQLLSTQNTNVFDPQCTFLSSIKVKKVKVHTLDMAPLHSDSPPQKRSGMTRVLKGFHTFTCTPTRSSAIGMSHTCLCLPSRSWYSFTDPRRDGRLSRQDISSIRPWLVLD